MKTNGDRFCSTIGHQTSNRVQLNSQANSFDATFNDDDDNDNYKCRPLSSSAIGQNLFNVANDVKIYIIKALSAVMEKIENKDPRFSSNLLLDNKDKWIDLVVQRNPKEYEVILQLNQMGSFCFGDHHMFPGYGSLRLCGGHKRSMSLWVEFITASGYLSAKKIRSRFLTVFEEAKNRSSFCHRIKMIACSQIKFLLDERIVVEIIPAFRCYNMWPSTARQLIPLTNSCGICEMLTSKELAAYGFQLLSRYKHFFEKDGQLDTDLWLLSFQPLEQLILKQLNREKCLSLLASLIFKQVSNADNQNKFSNSSIDVIIFKVITNTLLLTIILLENDKHCEDTWWDESKLNDRLNSCLLQLAACLTAGQCSHYFLPNLNLLSNFNSVELGQVSRHVWKCLRTLIFDSMFAQSNEANFYRSHHC